MTASGALLPGAIFADAVALLEELCGLSSASGDTSGLHAVAERLGAELRRHGLSVTIGTEPDADGRPQPVLEARGRDSHRGHLLLVGHLDTVLTAIAPQRDGHLLRATGALDMKGGLVTFAAALALLAARGQAPPDDLLFVAVSDEEVGGAISERAVRRWSERARAILVLEPGEGRAHGETLVAGRRGMAEWRLSVTGQASHSGLAYWDGRSALAAAAAWAARAQRLSEVGPGVTVNVARLVGGDADFVHDLARNHDLFGSARRRNIVSSDAAAEGEVRFLSNGDGERILTRLAAIAAEVAGEYEVAVRFEPGTRVPPVDPHGPGAPLVQRAVELAAARGWRLEIEEDRGGISFPNYVLDPSSRPVVDGLGPVGNGMHTREEYVDLRSLERRIVLLADLLATL